MKRLISVIILLVALCSEMLHAQTAAWVELGEITVYSDTTRNLKSTAGGNHDFVFIKEHPATISVTSIGNNVYYKVSVYGKEYTISEDIRSYSPAYKEVEWVRNRNAVEYTHFKTRYIAGGYMLNLPQAFQIADSGTSETAAMQQNDKKPDLQWNRVKEVWLYADKDMGIRDYSGYNEERHSKGVLYEAFDGKKTVYKITVEGSSISRDVAVNGRYDKDYIERHRRKVNSLNHYYGPFPWAHQVYRYEVVGLPLYFNL